MITKTTLTQPADEDAPWVLEFPGLDTINLGDPDIQDQVIKWQLADPAENGHGLIFKRNARLVAGKGHE